MFVHASRAVVVPPRRCAAWGRDPDRWRCHEEGFPNRCRSSQVCSRGPCRRRHAGRFRVAVARRGRVPGHLRPARHDPDRGRRPHRRGGGAARHHPRRDSRERHSGRLDHPLQLGRQPLLRVGRLRLERRPRPRALRRLRAPCPRARSAAGGRFLRNRPRRLRDGRNHARRAHGEGRRRHAARTARTRRIRPPHAPSRHSGNRRGGGDRRAPPRVPRLRRSAPPRGTRPLGGRRRPGGAGHAHAPERGLSARPRRGGGADPAALARRLPRRPRARGRAARGRRRAAPRGRRGPRARGRAPARQRVLQRTRGRRSLGAEDAGREHARADGGPRPRARRLRADGRRARRGGPCERLPPGGLHRRLGPGRRRGRARRGGRRCPRPPPDPPRTAHDPRRPLHDAALDPPRRRAFPALRPRRERDDARRFRGRGGRHRGRGDHLHRGRAAPARRERGPAARTAARARRGDRRGGRVGRAGRRLLDAHRRARLPAAHDADGPRRALLPSARPLLPLCLCDVARRGGRGRPRARAAPPSGRAAAGRTEARGRGAGEADGEPGHPRDARRLSSVPLGRAETAEDRRPRGGAPHGRRGVGGEGLRVELPAAVPGGCLQRRALAAAGGVPCRDGARVGGVRAGAGRDPRRPLRDAPDGARRARPARGARVELGVRRARRPGGRHGRGEGRDPRTPRFDSRLFPARRLPDRAPHRRRPLRDGGGGGGERLRRGRGGAARGRRPDEGGARRDARGVRRAGEPRGDGAVPAHRLRCGRAPGGGAHAARGGRAGGGRVQRRGGGRGAGRPAPPRRRRAPCGLRGGGRRGREGPSPLRAERTPRAPRRRGARRPGGGVEPHAARGRAAQGAHLLQRGGRREHGRARGTSACAAGADRVGGRLHGVVRRQLRGARECGTAARRARRGARRRHLLLHPRRRARLRARGRPRARQRAAWAHRRRGGRDARRSRPLRLVPRWLRDGDRVHPPQRPPAPEPLPGPPGGGGGPRNGDPRGLRGAHAAHRHDLAHDGVRPRADHPRGLEARRRTARAARGRAVRRPPRRDGPQPRRPPRRREGLRPRRPVGWDGAARRRGGAANVPFDSRVPGRRAGRVPLV